LARGLRLADTTPQGELASTGYALANRGREYVVLQPSDEAEPFTVELAAGTYDVEWFAVGARTTTKGERLSVARDGTVRLSAPDAVRGASVLHLRSTQRG
jgi:hypothetical protein